MKIKKILNFLVLGGLFCITLYIVGRYNDIGRTAETYKPVEYTSRPSPKKEKMVLTDEWSRVIEIPEGQKWSFKDSSGYYGDLEVRDLDAPNIPHIASGTKGFLDTAGIQRFQVRASKIIRGPIIWEYWTHY